MKTAIATMLGVGILAIGTGAQDIPLDRLTLPESFTAEVFANGDLRRGMARF
jgi:hypothetical protein